MTAAWHEPIEFAEGSPKGAREQGSDEDEGDGADEDTVLEDAPEPGIALSNIYPGANTLF